MHAHVCISARGILRRRRCSTSRSPTGPGNMPSLHCAVLFVEASCAACIRCSTNESPEKKRPWRASVPAVKEALGMLVVRSLGPFFIERAPWLRRRRMATQSHERSLPPTGRANSGVVDSNRHPPLMFAFLTSRLRCFADGPTALAPRFFLSSWDVVAKTRGKPACSHRMARSRRIRISLRSRASSLPHAREQCSSIVGALATNSSAVTLVAISTNMYPISAQKMTTRPRVKLILCSSMCRRSRLLTLRAAA